MSVLARYVVDAPRPVPPAQTLFGNPSTDSSTPADGHWTTGIELVGYPTIDAMQTYPGCNGLGSAAGDKTPSGIQVPDMFDPFTILIGVSCNPVSMNFAEIQARAQAAFEAYEHYPLERQVMAGTEFAGIPYLGDGNCTVVGSAGMTVTAGVAELEDAIAATGRQGVIHCSPGVAVIGSYGGVFTLKGSTIQTINGTPVIPAQGYQGDPPAGEDAGEYVYASTPFRVMRGGVEVLDPASAMIRRTNEAIVWVERDYAYAWDQVLQVAVNVDRTKE